MKVSVIAIGKLKRGAETELCERYRTRFDATGRSVALGPLTLIEIPESRAREAAARKTEEGEAAGARLPDGATVVACDEAAKQMNSRVFARWLAQERDSGTPHIVFVLGGPDGHAPQFAASASLSLSLGAMTLPHGLARVVLLEQLYRATTIATGHPYHRE